MSYLLQPTLPSTRGRLRDLTRCWPDLATSAALLGLAVLLALRWWQQADGVPLSWRRPSGEALFLLPAAPLMGLLALRTLGGAGGRSPASDQLTRATSRWAAFWAAVTATWLLATVTGLYGAGLRGLVQADNLLTVLAASDLTVPRVTAFWVALLVALFGSRLRSPRQSLGLLALVAAVLLAAAPPGGAGHAHATTVHPLVQITAGTQLLALVLWLGTAVAVLHVRRRHDAGPAHLTRAGDLLSGAGLVLGAAVVVAGLVRPDQATPIGVGAAQLGAVVVVAAVGRRHRGRTLQAISAGPRVLDVALVISEGVVLVAMIALSAVVQLT